MTFMFIFAAGGCDLVLGLNAHASPMVAKQEWQAALSSASPIASTPHSWESTATFNSPLPDRLVPIAQQPRQQIFDDPSPALR
jgi:hypothetical protein